MENLKKLIEKSGYNVKIVNQYKVVATKENFTINASSLQTLAIKLEL